MNAHKKIVVRLLIVAIVLVGLSGSRCLAALYDPVPIGSNIGDFISGSLSSQAGLITYDGWSDDPDTDVVEETTLSWTITNMGSYLKYCYTLTVPYKSPSHTIFAVSGGVDDPFTEDDLLAILSGQTDFEIKEYTGSGTVKPNPYLPFTFYGIKFESNTEGDTETVCFTTQRMPMEGYFYSADGTDDAGVWAVAYNDAVGGFYVPVPDTMVIPVPGALLLGLLGIGAAGMKLRKYA